MHTSSRSSGTTTASGITERQEKCNRCPQAYRRMALQPLEWLLRGSRGSGALRGSTPRHRDLGYRIWRPRSGHRAWMVIALGCWSSRTRLDGHLMLNCDCQLKIQLRVGVVSLFCGWIWSIMESVSNGLSHNQARCRLLAWQDIENARKKACSPGVALGLLHAVDLFEARLSRSRRHLPRRGSFTRRPMPRTSMATRGRRSRMCTRRDSANSLLEEMQTQGLRAIGDTIFDMAAGDTIVDMHFVRCMQA